MKRPEHSKAMKGKNNPFYGKKHTAEALKKIGEATKGRYFSPEAKYKMGSATRGKTLSEETRRKISDSKRGKPRDATTRLKLSIAHSGKKLTEEHKRKLGRQKENHPGWKGGVTYTYRLFRKSSDYQKWRKAVLERDSHTCIWCGNKEHLHVDHIKPFAQYPELRIVLSNGRVLCETCHKKTPTYSNKAPGAKA